MTPEQAAAVATMSTADLKQAVAHRVAAEAAALYTRHQEVHAMSRKPSAQRRADKAQAEKDQAHWQREKAKYEKSGKADPRGVATYDRAIARHQDTIDRNS